MIRVHKLILFLSGIILLTLGSSIAVADAYNSDSVALEEVRLMPRCL